MKRIFLIDCPGVVYPSAETDTEKVLKGVVRVELVTNPEDYEENYVEGIRCGGVCYNFLEKNKLPGKLIYYFYVLFGTSINFLNLLRNLII